MSNSRTKRQFTQEFKTESARIVTNQGYTCVAAAEAVGMSVILMAKWVRAYKEASGSGWPTLDTFGLVKVGCI